MKTASEISDAAATNLPEYPAHQEELPRAETAEEPVANGPAQETAASGSAPELATPSPATAEDQLLQKVLDKLRGMGVQPQQEAQQWSQHSWQRLAGM